MRRPARRSFVRALSLGVALSLSVPTVAAAAPAFKDGEAQALYDEGIERFDAGDFEGALEKLDASIAVERSTLALYAKAQSLNKLERCREAVPIYNEVLSTLPEESVADFGANYPMGRPAQPAELASAYVMLADPASSYTSGATVAVTGGKPII